MTNERAVEDSAVFLAINNWHAAKEDCDKVRELRRKIAALKGTK